jgi:1,4-dihydroxy-6-naphthoate synthase
MGFNRKKNSMTAFDFAFSPCPNDTFAFFAMVHSRIDTKGLCFIPKMHDIDALNNMAVQGLYPITKLSFYAYITLSKTYEMLESGAALGYKCGPLLVSKSGKIPPVGATIAIPGEYTTAHLLLKLWATVTYNTKITRFDLIFEGVQSGLYDAGLIIHEGRFVYPHYGLIKVIDLGEWWEGKTGLPIPLGCIAVNRGSEAYGHKHDIERIIQNSIEYSNEAKNDSKEFIKAHAQEMDESVIDQHIKLYVNNFSLSLGETGRKAVESLNVMAKYRGLL